MPRVHQATVRTMTIMEGCGASATVYGGLSFAMSVYPSGCGTGTDLTPSNCTCFDNNNVNNGPLEYSLGVNGGAGTNCALSSRFQ